MANHMVNIRSSHGSVMGKTIFSNQTRRQHFGLVNYHVLAIQSVTPNNGTTPYHYSHTTPIRIPQDMGIVWVKLTISGSHYWESWVNHPWFNSISIPPSAKRPWRVWGISGLASWVIIATGHSIYLHLCCSITLNSWSYWTSHLFGRLLEPRHFWHFVGLHEQIRGFVVGCWMDMSHDF